MGNFWQHKSGTVCELERVHAHLARAWGARRLSHSFQPDPRPKYDKTNFLKLSLLEPVFFTRFPPPPKYFRTNIFYTNDGWPFVPQGNTRRTPADAAPTRDLRRSVRSTHAGGRRGSAGIDC